MKKNKIMPIYNIGSNTKTLPLSLQKSTINFGDLDYDELKLIDKMYYSVNSSKHKTSYYLNSIDIKLNKINEI